MNLPDFLTQTPDSEIRLSGHRIALHHVVRAYEDGDSAEMIALEYPTLGLSLVHKTIAFYLDNRSEVDAYVAECTAELDEQKRSGRRVDMEALRRRLQVAERSAAPTPQAG